MTREEAAKVLTEKAEVWEGVLNHMVSAGDFSELKQIEDYETALRMGAAALRVSQPDPVTGLVPCGCGGKAGFHYSVIVDNDCYVECGICGEHSKVALSEDKARDAWNTAMGSASE